MGDDPSDRGEGKLDGNKRVMQDDDNVLVFKPQTAEMVARFARGTRWSIPQHWEDYKKQGYTLHFILNKQDKQKYAVLTSPSGDNMVYDRGDNEIPIATLRKITDIF